MLAAGEAAVIVGFNPEIQECENEAIEAFYEAWGCGYQVFAVNGWYQNDGPFGLSALSNGPSVSNEILRLVDASGVPSDIANYDDDSLVWPLDGTGNFFDDAWSIFVIPPASNYDAVLNDDGMRWGASFPGLDGGRTNTATVVYNGTMFGSPGHLENVQTPNLENCPTVDDCPFCPDTNDDGIVDLADLNTVLGNFNSAQTPGTNGDVTGDGLVDLADLNAILGAFNTSC